MDTENLQPNKIPAGYMAKHVAAHSDWIKAENIVDICSVSGCISKNFADYINSWGYKSWQHNGWWLFDAPEIIRGFAQKENIDLTGVRYFYYEVYDREYHEHEKCWCEFKPETSFVTQVQVPADKDLIGYDVVTFCAGTDPDHSPLSCNGIADEIAVNSQCLYLSFEDAFQALESGVFDNSEGNYILD